MRTADQIIPRLLASTGRQKRELDLLEIANDIRQLSDYLGGLTKVADIIGISTGMLNKFLAVHKLSTHAKELVKDRQIDSVELVNKLARFTTAEQEWISEQVIHGNLNSIDIRLLTPLRKQYPKLSLDELMEKLRGSENRRVSVIRFSSQTLRRNSDEVYEAIAKIVDSSELLDFNLNGDDSIIKLTPKGEQNLRKAAKDAKKPLQEFVYKILQ